MPFDIIDAGRATEHSRPRVAWDNIRVRLAVTGDHLMDWHCQQDDGVAIVAPDGPIDHQNASDFDTRLLAAVRFAAGAGDRLVIDLARVDYMSSAGLRVMARAAKEARDLSLDVAVAGLRDTMAEIFAISRFDRLFKVFDTVDTARKG